MLIKAKLWERQGILSTEILVFHNTLNSGLEQVLLPLTKSKRNLIELLVENNLKTVNNEEAFARKAVKKKAEADR